MTEVLMSHAEVMALLTETGAVRKGHFELPSKEHTDHYLQMPLALRYFNYARRLSVGLSRLLRLVPTVAVHLPDVSVISASNGGIPVAYGIREALQAREIMWAEGGREGNLHFRQYNEVHRGENCILVDDLILTGRTMKALIKLIKEVGGNILAIGVLVNPQIVTIDFGNIPFVSLVDIQTKHFQDSSNCILCKEKGTPTVVRW